MHYGNLADTKLQVYFQEFSDQIHSTLSAVIILCLPYSHNAANKSQWFVVSREPVIDSLETLLQQATYWLHSGNWANIYYSFNFQK